MDSLRLYGSEDSVFPVSSGGIDPGEAPIGDSRESVLEEAGRLSAGRGVDLCPDNVGQVMVAPFVTRYAYVGGPLTRSMNGQDLLFPTPSSPNTVICVGSDGTVLASEHRVLSSFLPDCRCLPLRVYDTSRLSGFSSLGGGLACCIEGDYIIPHGDGIGREAFWEVHDRYVGRPRISVEDVFHYVYAVLQVSPGDRVPLVRGSEGFWRLVDAGSELMRVHLVASDPEAASAQAASVLDRIRDIPIDL